MSAPAISLELRLEGGAAGFDPGARVAGVARWAAASIAPRGMELRLIWTLQGKWERDMRIAACGAQILRTRPGTDESRRQIRNLPRARSTLPSTNTRRARNEPPW